MIDRSERARVEALCRDVVRRELGVTPVEVRYIEAGNSNHVVKVVPQQHAGLAVRVSRRNDITVQAGHVDRVHATLLPRLRGALAVASQA